MNKWNIKWFDLLIIIFGNALLGFAYGIFLVPRKIVTGGTSGIAIIIKDIFNFPSSATIAILIWLFFLLGLIFFGRRFAAKTLVATVVLPLSTFLVEQWTWMIDQVNNIKDLWVIGLVAAMMSGTGIALTFRAGGSTGGLDILAYIIQKYFRIRLSTLIFFIDMIIILVGWRIFPLEQVLVGISVAFLTTLVMDRVMFGGTQTIQVQIITNKETEILNFIHNRLGRGSTIIPVIGGYSQMKFQMIQVLVHKRQLEELRDLIIVVDPAAFITIVNANVFGNGFREWKE